MEGHNLNINSKHGILALPSIKERLDAIIKKLKTQQLSKQCHKRELAEQVSEKPPEVRPEVISKLQAEESREEQRRKRQNHLQDLRHRLAELKKLHDARVAIKKFSRLSIVPHDEKKQTTNQRKRMHRTALDKDINQTELLFFFLEKKKIQQGIKTPSRPQQKTSQIQYRTDMKAIHEQDNSKPNQTKPQPQPQPYCKRDQQPAIDPPHQPTLTSPPLTPDP